MDIAQTYWPHKPTGPLRCVQHHVALLHARGWVNLAVILRDRAAVRERLLRLAVGMNQVGQPGQKRWVWHIRFGHMKQCVSGIQSNSCR